MYDPHSVESKQNHHFSQFSVQINTALEGMMKWNPSLRVSIMCNKRGRYEMLEDVSAKPRLLCYYNEQDWKRVSLVHCIPSILSNRDSENILYEPETFELFSWVHYTTKLNL